jgi:hypothetical protein
MSKSEKFLMVVFVFGGGFIAGLSGGNSVGLIVGGLAGLGALVVAYFVYDKVDVALARRYAKKRKEWE